jgi:hypothetical protein
MYLRGGTDVLRNTINYDIYTYRSTVYSSVSQTFLTMETFWAVDIQTEPKRHLEK